MNKPQPATTRQHRSILKRGSAGFILRLILRASSLAVLASSLLGAPAWAAAAIVVPRDFPTIQAAIDAAAAGSTIRVLAGSYVEQVVIAKNLTLIGAGMGSTFIIAPAALTPYALLVPPQLPVVAVVRVTEGATVSISGLTVSGPIPCGQAGQGISVVKSASLSLTNSRVTRVRQETACQGPAVGRGIVIGLPTVVQIDGQFGSTGNATIKGVSVDQYQTAGMSVIGPSGGPPSSAVLTDNSITGGASPFNFVAQSGMELVGFIDAHIKDNTVRDNACTFPFCGSDPITQVQSSGIEVESAAEVVNNQVSENDIGIYQLFAFSPATISDNHVENNRYFGIVIQDGDGSTNGNTITGGQVGIGVVADAVNTTGTLGNDAIRGTSILPIQTLDCCGFTATAIVLAK